MQLCLRCGSTCGTMLHFECWCIVNYWLLWFIINSNIFLHHQCTQQQLSNIYVLSHYCLVRFQVYTHNITRTTYSLRRSYLKCHDQYKILLSHYFLNVKVVCSVFIILVYSCDMCMCVISSFVGMLYLLLCLSSYKLPYAVTVCCSICCCFSSMLMLCWPFQHFVGHTHPHSEVMFY